MRTGDAVLHKPTGETWTVAAVSPLGDEIVCCGWPETIAKIDDCELVQACNDADHCELLARVCEHRDSLRGSWARFNRDAAIAARDAANDGGGA
jgi:hypothetical protein